MNKDIRWACMQPLTGGMYLGFENAIGHPAEFIISYSGLNEHRPSTTAGKRGHCGNEYNLMQYLNKTGRTVPRYEFSHGMFEMKNCKDVQFKDGSYPLFDDIDI